MADEGRWVTIRGARVFIAEGQSVSDAIKSRKTKNANRKKSLLEPLYGNQFGVTNQKKAIKKSIERNKRNQENRSGHVLKEDVKDLTKEEYNELEKIKHKALEEGKPIVRMNSKRYKDAVAEARKRAKKNNTGS